VCSLSVGHGAFRCGVLLNIYDISRFVGSQVSHVFVLVFWLWFETGPCCCCLCGGFGISLFFVAPFSLLAVFQSASAFNQDVSTWNMDAVTTTYLMFHGATAFADNNFFCAGSTNTGSWPTSVIRASDFDGSGVTDFSCSNTFLHNVMFKSVVDDWCEGAAKKTDVQTAHGSIEDWDVSRITNMNNLFQSKSSFNADLSKWSTSAVTTMSYSKCTLSPSLWPRRLPLWCVVEDIRHLEVRRITSLTRVILVFGCGLKRDLLLLSVWWVWSFFSLLFLCLSSCSVFFRKSVQSGRVHLEYRGGDNYV
jgi:surface protein